MPQPRGYREWRDKNGTLQAITPLRDPPRRGWWVILQMTWDALVGRKGHER